MKWKGSNRRRFPRANFACKIAVYTLMKHSLLSHTENIGEGGLRVIIDEKIELYSEVGLELYLRREPICCRGRIVWVVDMANPLSKETILFDTGIEFLDLTEKDKGYIHGIVDELIQKKEV